MSFIYNKIDIYRFYRLIVYQYLITSVTVVEQDKNILQYLHLHAAPCYVFL